MTEVRARPVIGPVVSSERTTSRKGLRKILGSTSESSAKDGHTKEKKNIYVIRCSRNVESLHWKPTPDVKKKKGKKKKSNVMSSLG